MSAIVGYWGYDPHEESDAILTKILAAGLATKTPQRFSLPESSNHLSDKRTATAAIAVWGSARVERLANELLQGLEAVGDRRPRGQRPRLNGERYSKSQTVQAQTYASGDVLKASLSASGLMADARVEISGECLVIGRDAFGRVPFYWTQRNNTVWFASRLQLLLPALESADVATAGLYGYACFSYVPTPLTPVRNMHALPAGSEAMWRSGHALSPISRRVSEWREEGGEIRHENEAIAELQNLLQEAIREQLADLPAGPVGVFLSGGLDSSVVAALLVREGVQVRAYTLDFGKYGLPEWPFAEQVAASLRIPLTKVPATPRRVRKALSATAEALDMPYGDGVTVPLFLLNEAASQDCAVVFHGEGGDQLFAGWTNKPLIASGIYGQLHPEGNDFDREYLRTFHRLHGYEAAVYSPQVLAEISELDPMEWLRDVLDGSFTGTLLHRLRRANLMLKGAQNIQPRATALALAHGLKARTPFCYKPLAEWTFRLAGELCLRGPCEKYLLKRAVEGWLPQEIVWREKRGMGVPLTAWCLGQLWREIGAWLNPNTLQAEGRWQPDLALRVATGNLSGHLQGRRTGEILWLLLMWQVWRRVVLKERFERSFYNLFWLPPRWWQWRYQNQEVS
ncbi:MAG TPA: asparagine synthetase B family protein [Blastocatellia bacterium]|nr:asparagine synthetase B family protein [Blastocatellia bacterium]